MGEQRIRVPKRETIERLEGHYQIMYGPQVITRNRNMAASLGAVIANIAEAERHLEGIFKAVVGGNSRILSALLASFRGHKQLLAAVQTALDESGNAGNAKTFQAIRTPIHDVWVMRDQVAHGIWADCDLFPGSALRLSARILGRLGERAKELFQTGDFDAAMEEFNNVDAEVWTPDDFRRAQQAAEGAVYSLMAFSACLVQPSDKARWLHTKLRSHGLLDAPPWDIDEP